MSGDSDSYGNVSRNLGCPATAAAVLLLAPVGVLAGLIVAGLSLPPRWQRGKRR